ncbi:deoxyguanosinetriphosphate triphosphohydrolase family protein [Chitinibacter bivalviorum]|uniref:Deoxyguanosinetriphosphate triphosphohydrolase-like protein n=1 Tax=Chitinibacter bivalviorum TaxID=2739434 RepID=A0A7H9BJE0_9NEIS|nr:anti-phage deoxyguanosine triphosphatase [Chitinibacter bivalviorum]QLG88770.1 deoxyguanosinetriphosphate triphosphohydrolase family protein [Chitinibacter bivalviorum]
MSHEPWQERRGPSTTRENDVRSEWDKDYARLIHSAAFRRLQSKTQVLGLGESDFYRTRLTHSMEVAQIGVGIVHWLRKKHEDNSEIVAALPCDTLISSICLAHDIGHPPFGHGGEVALNVCMREFGGFEGNGQTLRILSRLDKYTKEHGLNPTRRLLLGILKYPAPYSLTVCQEAYGPVPAQSWLSQAKQQHPPKCYMDSEQDVVNWILTPLSGAERTRFTELNTQTAKHSKPAHKALDTSIMELADDISYSLHDLEDAISLGMVTQKDWESHNADKQPLFEACGLNSQDLATQLFSDESYLRKNAIGGLVHLFIMATEVGDSGVPSATCELIKWNAVMTQSHQELLEHIFQLVLKKVIKSSNVQQLEFKGQKLVFELFEALNSDPKRLLPEKTILKYSEAADDQQKARIICDFISGMTDEYATRLYEKLYYPHKGSIFDRL